MTDVLVLHHALARLRDLLHLDGIDQTAVIRWDIVGGAETSSFQLGAAAGRWEFSDAVAAPSSLSVGLDVDDLLDLAAGRLTAGQAFLSGRLRLSGDLALAQRVLPGFDVQRFSAPRPDRTAP